MQSHQCQDHLLLNTWWSSTQDLLLIQNMITTQWSRASLRVRVRILDFMNTFATFVCPVEIFEIQIYIWHFNRLALAFTAAADTRLLLFVEDDRYMLLACKWHVRRLMQLTEKNCWLETIYQFFYSLSDFNFKLPSFKRSVRCTPLKHFAIPLRD